MRRIETALDITPVTTNSLLERLPIDICVMLAVDLLAIWDIRALLMTSKALHQLFSHDRLWSRLLNRTFRISHYREGFYAHYQQHIASSECVRLVAYAQVHLNPVTRGALMVDPHGLHATAAMDHYLQLGAHLAERQYIEFMMLSNSLLSMINVDGVHAQKSELQSMYQKICLSGKESCVQIISDLVEACQWNAVNQRLSENAMIHAMVRLLAKCGAIKSLSIILDYISSDAELKNQFFHYYASALLCDSINFHKPAVVALLLAHGVPVNSHARKDSYTDNWTLPLECALQSLTRLYETFEAKGHITQSMLNAVNECLSRICNAGADPDIVTDLKMNYKHQAARRTLFVLPAPVFAVNTLRSYALGMYEVVKANANMDELTRLSFMHAYGSLKDHYFVDHMNLSSDEEEEVFTTRTESFMEAGEPSPKKVKSTPGTPEKAEADNAEAADTPVRVTGIGKLSFR